MEAIRIDHLTKQYKEITAVKDLTFSIHPGELFALLGVNGAGKTTTIKMLSCLTAPTSGDALVLGSSIVKNPEKVKAHIGLSPQETAVAPKLTARENLAFMAGLYGFSKEKTKAKMEALAETFGLKEVMNRPAGKLSGGWQRRLSLALALISEPSILFLDEPTLGLDVIAREELWSAIRALKGSVTMILTTHYMEEAQELSDRVGIMKGGKLLALGTAAELMAETGTPSLEKAFISFIKEAAQ